MKRTTRAFLWLTGGVAAAVGGAWAWANRDRAVASALTSCRPTPEQLDAFGKHHRIRIIIGGTETPVGDLAAPAGAARYEPTKGILQQTAGDVIVGDARLTAALCAYVTKANIANQVRANL